MAVVWTKETVTKNVGYTFESATCRVEIDTEDCEIEFYPTTGRDVESEEQFAAWLKELTDILPQDALWYVERYPMSIYPPDQSFKRMVTAASCTAGGSSALAYPGVILEPAYYMRQSLIATQSGKHAARVYYSEWQMCEPLAAKAHESEGI